MEQKGILIIFGPIKESCFSSLITSIISCILLIGGFFSSLEWMPVLLGAYFSASNLIPSALLFLLLFEIGAIMQAYEILRYYNAVAIIAPFLSILLFIANRLLGIYTGLSIEAFPKAIFTWIGYIMCCIELGFILTAIFVGMAWAIFRTAKESRLQREVPGKISPIDSYSCSAASRRGSYTLHPFLAFLIIAASTAFVIVLSCVYYNRKLNGPNYKSVTVSVGEKSANTTSAPPALTKSADVLYGYIINVDSHLLVFSNESRESVQRYSISRGACINILSDDVTAEWYHIEYQGVEAYAESKYIVVDNSSTTGVVNSAGGSVLIYKFADKQRGSVGRIPNGSTILVLSVDAEGGWYIIRFGDAIGYVMNTYIDIP